MLRHFILAFVALIVPAAFVLALLMAPASPAAPLELPGCERNTANANANIVALQARVKASATCAVLKSATSPGCIFLKW